MARRGDGIGGNGIGFFGAIFLTIGFNPFLDGVIQLL
jgi:hypothetical protein